MNVMTISVYTCGSCALSTISNLGTHTDALAAMVAFCKLEMPPTLSFKTVSKNGECILAPFYVYVAGPEVAGHGHSKAWVRYASEFTQFILDNHLGTVVTNGPKQNQKHHPDTTCQTWVWSPDQKAMEQWWQGYKKRMGI